MWQGFRLFAGSRARVSAKSNPRDLQDSGAVARHILDIPGKSRTDLGQCCDARAAALPVLIQRQRLSGVRCRSLPLPILPRLRSGAGKIEMDRGPGVDLALDLHIAT
jgi:hypothetical protein